MNLPQYTSTDNYIFNNEIKPYLPARIFDAHTHLQIPQFHPNLAEILPITKDPLFGIIDMPTLEAWWKALFPDIEVSGLVLGMPTRGCDCVNINKYISKNVDSRRNRFSILAGPQFTDRQLEDQIVKLKPHGLKPYMCFSRREVANESDLTDLIPESQIALADKYKLAITLHVAKSRGMADSDNLRDIVRLVKDYPNAKFVLAHCGRCFISPNMEEALKHLPVAPNLYIDTSAVCEMGVFMYLFTNYPKDRILFGTDLVTAAGFRGTYVRMGMSWDWSLEQSVQRAGGQQIRATFAVYENLASTCHAARFCKLSTDDMENIFYNNAADLFDFNK